MFFEKWFDEGDLIMYAPDHSHVAFDSSFNPYKIEGKQFNEVGVFLGYTCEDSFDSCRIFLSSKQKSIIVAQRDLRLLSKKR